MALTSEAQIKAVKKYNEANTTQIKLCLNNKTDADILEKLNKVEKKQTYIKDLIRKDIANK